MEQHNAEIDKSGHPLRCAWLAESLAVPATSPCRLTTSRAILEDRWKQHLHKRVAADTNVDSVLSILTRATASNYERYVRKFINYLEEQSADSTAALENAVATDLPGHTETFLLELNERNSNYERAVRSVILHQFLPWAKEQGFIKVDLTLFESLSPLPYKQFTIPIIESWLQDQFPKEDQRPAANQYRMVLRSFLLHTAKLHLGIRHQDIMNDARNFLAQELAGESRIARVVSTWQSVKKNGRDIPEPPYDSAIENVLWDRSSVGHFITKLTERKKTRDTIKHPISRIRKFYLWAHRNQLTLIDPETIKNPFTAGEKPRVLRSNGTPSRSPSDIDSASHPDESKSEKSSITTRKAVTNRPESKAKTPKSGKKSAAGAKSKSKSKSKLTTSVKKYKPGARRSTFDTHLRRMLDQRDELVTQLVRTGSCTFAEVCTLTVKDCKFSDSDITLTLPERGVVLISDPSLRDLLTRYLVIRSATTEFPRIDHRDAPFILSADGGSLVVEPDPEDRGSRELLQIRRSQNFIISHLLEHESISFSELRQALMGDLLRQKFTHPESANKVKAYAQIMRVMPLSSAITAPPMGPGIAFPGADGWQLTGDE